MVFGTWYVVYAIGLLLIGINITQASSEMEVLDPKILIFCQKILGPNQVECQVLSCTSYFIFLNTVT